MSEVLKAIAERRSGPKEIIQKIIEAGNHAPSAHE